MRNNAYFILNSFLIMSLTFLCTNIYAASFDCLKASTRIDKTICNSIKISKLDSDLNLLYRGVIGSSADPEAMKIDQRNWLNAKRNACQDEACLIAVYEQRIAHLSNAMTIKKNNVDKSFKKVPVWSDDAQIKDGYTLIWTNSDGSKMWWKNAPEFDHKKWKFALSRNIVAYEKFETDKIAFNCEMQEMGLPVGPKDTDVVWSPIGENSNMDKVLKFICGSKQSEKLEQVTESERQEHMKKGKASIPADRVMPKPVGQKLTESQSQMLFDMRLGRCAAAFAKAGAYPRAEEIMSGSSNRDLTRGTYVALLKLSLADADGAKINYMDACYSIGMIDGTDKSAFFKAYEYYLSEYESTHSDVLPQAGAKIAAEVAKRARDPIDAKSVREIAIENDPVKKLRIAYATFNTKCMRDWGVSTQQILKQIDSLGLRNFDNQTASVEIRATGIASKQLNGLRYVNCAK